MVTSGIVSDVDELIREGRATYPTVALARADVERVGGDRLAQPGVLADLYLAIGLELGAPAALAVFERELLPGIRAALAHACRRSDVVDEIVQRVRVRVLVGDAGARPKIATYTGRGRLYAWLRVTALRMFTNLARAEGRGDARDELATAAATSLAWPTPDRLLLDARHGPALREALGAALGALAPRERTLLRLHYLEGLALEAIATIYAVNKSTVSRWIAAAREGLLQHALGALRTDALAPADTEELESLCAYLCGRLDLSLSRLLGEP